MFQLVGACFDGGTRFYGSRLGPQAVRLAGINRTFKNAAISFLDVGDISVKSQVVPDEPLKGLTWGNQFYPLLTQKIERIFQNQYFSLIIGGDQSIRLATLTAALNQHDPDELGIIWIDPHIHFEELDKPHSIYQIILSSLFQHKNQTHFSFLSHKPLKPSHIAFLGPEYQGHYDLFNQSASMINQKGTSVVIERILFWIKRQNIKKLWISFNIQSIDQFYTLGEIPSPGLTIDQAFNLAKELNRLCCISNIELIGVEALEINPILDPFNQSSHVTLQWLTYLLEGLKKESFSKKKEFIHTG